MKIKNTLTKLLLLILSILTNCGQIEKERALSDKIEQYLTALENVGFHGSVLVAINGKPIISKGCGFSDNEKQIKNTPNTIFDIGSITKQFTSAAILKLEMQGKISTDDKISKFFDHVPEDKQKITIHDLLRHQSGLISNVGRDFDKITKKEFLVKVLNSKLAFEPGTDGAYSNIAYSLLAMIIENVSNQNYETFLFENLWLPAKMNMTGYTRPNFNKSLVSTGYYQNDSIWGKPTDKEWDTNAPYWHLKGNGGILSTIEDLYKWHKCLMSEIILSKEAKQKFYHPKLRAGESEKGYYAYGWEVSTTDRNTTQVWHNGSNRILYADFLRYIDENITFIMLSNKSHPNFNNLNFEMARMVFNPNFNPEIPIADTEENRIFTNDIIKSIEQFGLEKAKEQYNKINNSEQLLEFLMREEGFTHIDNGEPEIALQIFEMNVFAYPKSAEAIQGLGEAYMETGNKDLALKYFQESLRINPDNRFVNEMIKQLEK